MKKLFSATTKSACILMLLTIIANCHRSDLEETPTQSATNVQVFLGQNFSTTIGAEWLRRNNGDYLETSYLKESNLQIVLPSGKNLHYTIASGKIDQENQTVKAVYVRLSKTTPELKQQIDNLIAELHLITPESLQKCESDLRKVHNLNPDPSQTIGGDIGACNFEIEKGIYLRAGINTIRVQRREGLVAEWLISLDFYLENAWKSQFP